MRRLLPLAVLLAACASGPAPESAPPPVWRTVEQCDSDLFKVSGLDVSSGTKTQGVQAPKLIERVAPEAPNFSGTQYVQVESVIDETGHISRICRVSGDPRFVDSVLQAMRQWVFEPATHDGKPVKVLFDVTTRFHR